MFIEATTILAYRDVGINHLKSNLIEIRKQNHQVTLKKYKIYQNVEDIYFEWLSKIFGGIKDMGSH